MNLPERRLAWKWPRTETGSGDSACSFSWFATHKVSDTNVKAPSLTLRFYTKRTYYLLPLTYVDLYVSSIRYVYLVKVVFGGASVHMFGVWGSLRMEGEGGGLFRGGAFVKSI